MQRYVDCRVQFVKRWEDHTLYVKIHRLVQQLDGVFDKGLVLGMTYPGRIYGASVIFGEGRELLVDHRLVAVACLYSRLKIVGHNGSRHTPEVFERVLTGLDQVFLALRPYGLAVGVMTEGKDGDEHLRFLDLSCHFVHHLQPVSGEVDVHLIGGVMLDVSHHSGVEPVLPDSAFEHGLLKTVGMFAFILVEELADRHALAGEPGHIARYQSVQLQLALRRLAVTELRASEHLPEMFFRELKQLFGSLAA